MSAITTFPLHTHLKTEPSQSRLVLLSSHQFTFASRKETPSNAPLLSRRRHNSRAHRHFSSILYQTYQVPAAVAARYALQPGVKAAFEQKYGQMPDARWEKKTRSLRVSDADQIIAAAQRIHSLLPRLKKILEVFAPLPLVRTESLLPDLSAPIPVAFPHITVVDKNGADASYDERRLLASLRAERLAEEEIPDIIWAVRKSLYSPLPKTLPTKDISERIQAERAACAQARTRRIWISHIREQDRLAELSSKGGLFHLSTEECVFLLQVHDELENQHIDTAVIAPLQTPPEFQLEMQ